MALEGVNKRRSNLVSFGGEQTVEREREGRGKERRRGRGRGREEEEKKKQSQKGMELTLCMDSSMDHMDFVWNSRKFYEFQT